jgi:flagellar basal-body rod protein FlgG
VLPKTGYPIQPIITIPAGTQNVKVNDVGQVYAVNNGLETLLGQINLAYFMNPTGLDPIGNSMYQATTSSGVATVGIPGTSPLGTIMSGWREGSNINPVEEITDLIQLGKIYEMLTKVLKTGDEMLNATNRVGH